jgi:hypothetical protein
MLKCPRGLALISLVYVLTSCGLSSQQKAATKEAMVALGKVQAATQVGVNFAQYSSLVIEAKAKANQMAVIPNGALKDSINSAVESYADAGQVWNERIQHGGDQANIWSKFGVGETLIPKYSLPVETGSFTPSLGESVRCDLAMQLIWAEAEKRYQQAVKQAPH